MNFRGPQGDRGTVAPAMKNMAFFHGREGWPMGHWGILIRENGHFFMENGLMPGTGLVSLFIFFPFASRLQLAQ